MEYNIGNIADTLMKHALNKALSEQHRQRGLVWEEPVSFGMPRKI